MINPTEIMREFESLFNDFEHDYNRVFSNLFTSTDKLRVLSLMGYAVDDDCLDGCCITGLLFFTVPYKQICGGLYVIDVKIVTKKHINMMIAMGMEAPYLDNKKLLHYDGKEYITEDCNVLEVLM